MSKETKQAAKQFLKSIDCDNKENLEELSRLLTTWHEKGYEQHGDEMIKSKAEDHYAEVRRRMRCYGSDTHQ